MKPAIFGIKGFELLPEEERFFKRTQPLGFILFQRNCKTPEQVQKLVKDLKSCVEHKNVPILIDQEGGRVTRLKPPYFRSLPPASIFGEEFKKNPTLGEEWCFENYKLIASELWDLGINVNCAPCSDLIYEGAHSIIGDRAFSKDLETIVALSLEVIRSHVQYGVIPVIKHMPGHGRALIDSHLGLPIISTDASILCETDFSVFRLLSKGLPVHPFGMTAHIIYKDFDAYDCATQSEIIIHQVIRKHIGFKGFLISDCISMEALQGPMSKRAEKAYKAGCDAVLYCKGDLDSMLEVASALPSINAESLQRLESTFELINNPKILTKEEFSYFDKILKNKLNEAGYQWKDQYSYIGE